MSEALLSTIEPGSQPSDPPLLRVAHFLRHADDNFEFDMNVMYYENQVGEQLQVTGCIVGATLRLYRNEVYDRWKCPVNMLPICGIPFTEPAQELLQIEDDQFEQLCYPLDINYKEVTNIDAAKACIDLYQNGNVDWLNLDR